MWNEICDEQHDADTMRTMNRLFLTIVACFLTFGGYALVTRLGADAPPASVAYGTQKAAADAVTFGD